MVLSSLAGMSAVPQQEAQAAMASVRPAAVTADIE